MTENLVYMLLGWAFAGFTLGIQWIMYRHGDRSLWKGNKRSPLFAIEGWAALFSAAVIYALLRTWLLIDPAASVHNISFIVCLFVCQIVFTGSLYLAWKLFPEFPSFFGWRDSRETNDASESNEDAQQTVPTK
ncbi:hypothetical protein KQI52_06220 [bacterium]|nr:hypothetical protein [bacterium]